MRKSQLFCVAVLPLWLVAFTNIAHSQDQTLPDTEEVADEPEPESKPGLFEVDEEAATRALERSLIQLGALLLSSGHAELGVDFSYGFNSRSSPVLIDFTDPETEEVTTTVGTVVGERRNYGLILDWRFGLPGDTQLDFSIPIENSTNTSNTFFAGSSIGNESETVGGLDDISISLLKTLLKEKGRRPDVIGRFTFNSDSGMEDQGVEIGSGTNEYTLGLSATKRQDPLVFTYGLSHTISSSVSGFTAGTVTQLSLGTVLAASPYTSLKLSFDQITVGKSDLEGESIDGSGANIGIFSIGASSVISRTLFVSANVGIGLSDNANDYSISIGLTKRVKIGG